MKKLLLLILLIVTTLMFAVDLGVLAGTEIGGRQRTYIGVQFGTTASLIGLSLDVYYPISFEELEEIEFEDITLVEFDPYLLLVIPLRDLKIYAGAAPILLLDLEEGGLGLYSDEVFHVKAGVKIGSGIAFTLEVLTTMTLDFMSTGIYAVTAGLGLSF
ncbi:hypothetical protein JYK00_00125 [Thermosipho ferrireducens]|uniref:Outer membrane protein beta-barrel domain-containing protein n=1 Tax=Thermosipho ferrireducens TaxID=2571116 RepID=A0ABX7S8Q2_9BACT|nr:hypothetical protein [Thermosipho ferrireducens]QTA37997.1 hypothetical protein JYK00_00125 [Thermosipho ferrireducens]